MFIIDKAKCIGCGLCVRDCPANDILLDVAQKAEIKNANCIKCGHCVAICPKDAVYTTEYSMDDVQNYEAASFALAADNLYNFVRFRRSVRKFLPRAVEQEKIEKILNAGRFAPTGGNRQNVTYTVIRESKEAVRVKALESLYNISASYINSEEWIRQRFGRNWVKMYERYQQDPNSPDGLFFGAPVVILISSNMPSNAGPAAGYMELMANALGLGVCFVNFFVRALENSQELRDMLVVDNEVIYCMVVGYTNNKYFRTAPRKGLQVTWK